MDAGVAGLITRLAMAKPAYKKGDLVQEALSGTDGDLAVPLC